MKLHELEAVKQPELIEDPCRLLGPQRPRLRQIAREELIYAGGGAHVAVVMDDETGLITRRIMFSDGSLGPEADDWDTGFSD